MPTRERGSSAVGFRAQLLARLRNQARASRVSAQRLQQRLQVHARLAGETFARFHIDISSGDALVATPDTLEGSDLLGFAGIAPIRFPVYPVVQHLAEKLHAYTLPRSEPNARAKDLVDLAILAVLETVVGDALLASVQATFVARASHMLPARLPDPPAAWAAPYARLAGESSPTALTNLRDGFALAAAFWQPLLDGAVTGRRWHPRQRAGLGGE